MVRNGTQQKSLFTLSLPFSPALLEPPFMLNAIYDFLFTCADGSTLLAFYFAGGTACVMYRVHLFLFFGRNDDV